MVTFQGEGYNNFKVNLGDGDVKRRKDEIFEGNGVIVWGIPKLGQKDEGIGLKKKIENRARFPLTLLEEVVYCAA